MVALRFQTWSNEEKDMVPPTKRDHQNKLKVVYNKGRQETNMINRPYNYLQFVRATNKVLLYSTVYGILELYLCIYIYKLS